MSYREIDLDAMGHSDGYKLFVTAIVPRPIGWISTRSRAGVRNAAPFSWFNAICADPLMVMISIGKRRGRMKDTAENIRDTGEFVVNVATADNAERMVATSADHPPEVDEFDVAGLTPLASTRVAPDRIAESPVHIECRLERMLALGEQPIDVVIGRCLCLHVDETVIAADGGIDARKLRPLGRLGRDEYSIVQDVIRYARPPRPGAR
jgi:flavin reductase (DIM6/NTAB) family NADH-FMN oxidoreductase RutF